MKALSVLLCCILGAGAQLVPFQFPQTLGRTGDTGYGSAGTGYGGAGVGTGYGGGAGPGYGGYQPQTQQYSSQIFTNCFQQAQIPMSVALGNYVQFQFMCSGDFFQYCRTQLPVALTQSMQLYPNQQNYVMNHLLNWVDGGGRFLCSMGQSILAGLMQNGGQDCIQTTAATKIGFCQNALGNLITSLDYNNGYCGQLDNSMQCFIDAVNMCPNNGLRDFLWDFFKSVQKQGPCAGTSRFTNSASKPAKNTATAIVSAIVLVFVMKTFFS